MCAKKKSNWSYYGQLFGGGIIALLIVVAIVGVFYWFLSAVMFSSMLAASINQDAVVGITFGGVITAGIGIAQVCIKILTDFKTDLDYDVYLDIIQRFEENSEITYQILMDSTGYSKGLLKRRVAELVLHGRLKPKHHADQGKLILKFELA